MIRTFWRRSRKTVRAANRAARPARRLSLEQLEDRLTPSGGRGSALPDLGGGHDDSASAPSAAVVRQLLPGSGSVPKGLVLDDTITAPGPGGEAALEIFSKYPLPPGSGPAPKDQLLAPSLNAASVPTDQTTGAVIPLFLTTTGPVPTSTSSTPITVVAVDPTLGTVVTFTVTLVPSTGTGSVASAPAAC